MAKGPEGSNALGCGLEPPEVMALRMESRRQLTARVTTYAKS